jgi:hypothetical protein
MTKKQYRAIVRKQGIMFMVAAVCALALSIAFVAGLVIHCRQSCQVILEKGASCSN